MMIRKPKMDNSVSLALREELAAEIKSQRAEIDRLQTIILRCAEIMEETWQSTKK